MNEALNNILSRRSIRSFTDEQLTEEELNTMLEAALNAPTGRNTQNTVFTVLQGEALARAGRTISREGFASFYYNAPTLIVVSAPKDSWHGNADSACALENMLLAAHAMGLGAVWINQVRRQGEVEAPIRAMYDDFGIPADHIAFGSVAVGHPNAGPRAKTVVREGRILRP